jgi:hypothetical protein
MVANVSRVLNTVLEVANPYNSLVRPSTEEDGMCRNFFNVHHELDPFTWPKRFKRVKTDNWIRQSDFNERYLDIETQMVTRYNTHDIKQYFEDPRVLGTFAHFVLEKGITVEELEAAEESYRAGSIEGAGAKIRNTFMNIELDDQGSIKDFFKAMDKGIDFLKDMEENG